MKRAYYLYSFNQIVFKNKLLVETGEIKIPQNAVTLLTGKNGTGKSTLLKQMYQTLFQGVVFITQENNEIFENLSVMENITLCQDNIDERKIIQLLDKYGVESLLHKNCKTLSGGEKRLIAVLRGMMAKEAVVLMDEPTNDLDYKAVDVIINLMNEFKEEKTILCVTHDERLFNIASTIYTIENKELQSKQNKKEMEEEIAYTNEKRKNLNKKSMIKQIYSKDYCNMILFLLITIVTGYFFINTLQGMNRSIDRIKDNQIELCNALYCSPSELLNKGYLPTNIISLLREEMSKQQLEQQLEALLKEENHDLYSLSLDVRASENYKVFTLGLYDVENSIAYSVLDTYMEEILELDTENYFIDTSEYFVLEKEEAAGKQPIIFEESIYQKTLDKLYEESNKKLEKTFIQILLSDHYSFTQFIEQEEFTEIWEGNYFIRSNETIYMVETAQKISKYKEGIKNWGVICGILYALLLINSMLHIGLQRKKNQILANYGFEKKQILNAFIYRSCNLAFYLWILCVVCFVFSLLLIYYRQNFDVRELMIPVVYVVSVGILQYFQRVICRYQVAEIFRVEGKGYDI